MFPASMQIAGFDPELATALDHERTRQEEHIELIASENYASPAVMAAQGSQLTNKYAEGYPGKRYYGGCENVDVAEKLARFWTQGCTATSVNFPAVDLPNVRSGQVRILHVHKNVPGVLSKMHTLLANAGVNINAEHLQSDQNTSYVILDVDAFQDANIMNALRTLPETIRMRVAG